MIEHRLPVRRFKKKETNKNFESVPWKKRQKHKQKKKGEGHREELARSVQKKHARKRDKRVKIDIQNNKHIYKSKETIESKKRFRKSNKEEETGLNCVEHYEYQKETERRQIDVTNKRTRKKGERGGVVNAKDGRKKRKLKNISEMGNVKLGDRSQDTKIVTNWKIKETCWTSIKKKKMQKQEQGFMKETNKKQKKAKKF